ncbi:MAG: glutaredoxin family protein [Gammaproteobacteria bacterium]|nr:glutaredoxin family protein [Gammaproteobacteria bacterium]
MVIWFYTTSGCHLCEEADALLKEFQGIQINVCDISESDALIDLYGTRIPVLRRDNTSTEMGWPFDREDLVRFFG